MKTSAERPIESLTKIHETSSRQTHKHYCKKIHWINYKKSFRPQNQARSSHSGSTIMTRQMIKLGKWKEWEQCNADKRPKCQMQSMNWQKMGRRTRHWSKQKSTHRQTHEILTFHTSLYRRLILEHCRLAVLWPCQIRFSHSSGPEMQFLALLPL